MRSPLKLVATSAMAVAIGVFATMQAAFQRFDCTAPDGSSVDYYGTILPYRTRFDVNSAEVPVLWLLPFIVNALPIMVIAWLLIGRPILRRGRPEQAIKVSMLLIGFAAFLVWFTVLGFGAYQIETATFGPDLGSSQCDRAFGVYEGAVSSYSF